MNPAKTRIRGMLTMVMLTLVLLYAFLVSNVTIVSVETQDLEPSLLPGELVFMTKSASIQPGDVVAIEDSGAVHLRRVFAMGPVTVSCVKHAGFIQEELVPFTSSAPDWVSAHVTGQVSERWGSISVPIKRKMKLVPRGLSDDAPRTVVKAGAFLVGCQNRIECSGCGFDSYTKAQVLGRMRDNEWLTRYLGKIGTLWR